MDISLPYNWTPRPYQMEVFEAFNQGMKRAFLLWHRRAGKDDFALHFTACQAMQRPGNYWHMLPNYNQCRKAIWEAVNPRTGLRRIDEAFPLAIRDVTRTQDMSIKFINGSTWQLIGSDTFDSLVGAPPVGLVFSEYALADPRAWAYLRPILADNGGWSMMITTPRAKNHAYTLYNHAEQAEDWFCSKITATESGLFTPEQLENERRELVAEFGEDEGGALFRQEYFCDFHGAVSGSYFRNQITTMEQEQRITSVPYNPALPVITGWDIGVGDSMAIVFAQKTPTTMHVIDYYEVSGEGVQTAAKVLRDKPYVYETHVMPHDISVREWSNDAKTRYQTALELGIKPINLVKRTNKAVDERIHAIRTALPTMYIDKKKCAPLIEHLKNYRKKWNEIMKEWENRPVHGPESHGVDSLGCLLTGYHTPVPRKTATQIMDQINYAGAW